MIHNYATDTIVDITWTVRSLKSFPQETRMGTETEIGKGGEIQYHSLVDMLISNNKGIIMHMVMKGNNGKEIS